MRDVDYIKNIHNIYIIHISKKKKLYKYQIVA